MTRALYPVEKNLITITKLPRAQSEQLNWSNINFPMKLTNVSSFEKQNENIAVNVLSYERNFYPLRINKGKKIHISIFLSYQIYTTA